MAHRRITLELDDEGYNSIHQQAIKAGTRRGGFGVARHDSDAS